MTAFDLAQRYVGIAELSGDRDHPLITWWLSLSGFKEAHDEVPWCSAFVNGICWELRLPRSKSAAARSWLEVGRPLGKEEATPGFDVVIIKRGLGGQPGPEVLNAQGHVGFFAGVEGDHLLILGGNQGDAVNVGRFPVASLLGIRRLA
jgi:uncharacterized protein (TIGR02594 family)